MAFSLQYFTNSHTVFLVLNVFVFFFYSVGEVLGRPLDSMNNLSGFTETLSGKQVYLHYSIIQGDLGIF